MNSKEPFDSIDLQQKNARLAKFMGGKIVPFNMPNGVTNVWYGCEIEDVNGIDSDRNILQFHTDWNYIMAVWNKITSMDQSHKVRFKNHDLCLSRQEIDRFGVLLVSDLKRTNKQDNDWVGKVIYHSFRLNPFLSHKPDYICKDLKEAYYKTIIDFVEWYIIETTDTWMK